MERLLIYIKDDVIKARLAAPHEKLEKPRRWKEIEFDTTSSPLLMITWPILLPELEPEAARSLLDIIGARYPFSSRYNELKLIAPELAFSESNDEWVFFGGSFNPWHKGHQACLDLLPIDKTCFILPDRNPQKEVRALEPVFTTISLISKIKFGKHHFIAPSFLMDQEKNPTVTWIEKLRADYPEKKLSLLLGFDSFRDLKTWIRFDELLKHLSSLYVVSRLEEPEEQQAVEAPLKSFASELNIVFLGHHQFENLSSTHLRG